MALAPGGPLRTLTRLLDITRSLRRAGQTPTGIDRVEGAYLAALCTRSEPFFAIARTGPGYVLLDAGGAAAMARALATGRFDPLDLLGRARPHRPTDVRRAEATMRRLAHARCLPSGLGRMLRRSLPAGLRYLNVGHVNFTPRMIAALDGCAAHVAVLVHDAIPLDAPHWQRPGTEARFRGFLCRVEDRADLVIHSAEATRRSIAARMRRPPPGITAPLGVEIAAPAPLPPNLRPEPPYFVALGTIEPRKNHALLLDVWRTWGPGAPTLVIAGRRGWANAAVFAALDRGLPGVIEVPGLSDGQVATLLEGAQALLFPSHLEGFGLPAMEAAARGVPVLAQDLAVLREIMGDVPHYLPGDDAAAWRARIAEIAARRPAPPPFAPPRWETHFNAVLRMT